METASVYTKRSTVFVLLSPASGVQLDRWGLENGAWRNVQPVADSVSSISRPLLITYDMQWSIQSTKDIYAVRKRDFVCWFSVVSLSTSSVLLSALPMYPCLASYGKISEQHKVRLFSLFERLRKSLAGLQGNCVRGRINCRRLLTWPTSATSIRPLILRMLE